MSPLTYTVPHPEERNRLSVAFRWVLAVPHLLLWAMWFWVAQALSFLQWFVIVFGGQRNQAIWEVQAVAMRSMARALGYSSLLFDRFPAFFADDDPSDGGELEMSYAASADRLSNGLRLILIIPAFVVSVLVGLVQIIVATTSWFSIVITGRQPERQWSTLVDCTEFALRFQAYSLLMTDAYPRFGSGTARSTASSRTPQVLSARGGTH